jgi:hypothetical protein
MFLAVFSSSLSSGPLSGHKKIEIYKDKQRIIFTKRGGHGLIPTKFPLRKIRAKKESDFPSKSKHIASKIKLWEGVIHTDEGVIHTICWCRNKVARQTEKEWLYTQ